MNIDDVALFSAAAGAGSLSEAARRLGLTPMIATRRLASLERALGVRLMHRTTRSLSLTAEGESFLPYAQALVETEQQARALLHGEDEGAAGLLRVSAPVAFAIKVIAPLIPSLLESNPGLRISLDMSDSMPDLVSSGTDLAIRIARLKDSSLIARKLADNPRSLVASPAYLEKHGTPHSAGELAQHDCLPLYGVTHWTFLKAGVESSWRLQSRFSSTSIEGCHAACLAGAGIALLSDWNVADDLSSGRLARVTLEDAEPETLAIWAVYPTSRFVPPKVRVFIDALASALKAIKGSGT
ncbi:LysR family transcriptional regulator [Sinorhizobium glycinis]|uniref:LysR family transcriptional regulator n=1 Tax=Sinorhizobium glycinis TaxID=1472378 RepID=A0A178XSJ6_9HYPH|nr:LysR family transcriptional regulator [Sinorhizobium glycinis]OAP38250.1 LysR family transcriptional regulator [Sinorhizobium glycinis]